MDQTNANTALASALAEELARCGVRRAVISPGSRSTPLAVALWREPAIDAEVVVDERSAGFVALGSALASGVPAVVVCTSGSAAANLHPAVVEADEASVPLIVLTADRPPELRGIGAGQAIDQLKLYGGSPRWFCEVGTHAADDSGLLHFRSTACRAYAAAAGDPRPGPVHLNVPWREPLAPVADPGAVTATDPLALEGRGESPLTAVDAPAAALLDGDLDSLTAALAAEPKGLIVAGRMAPSTGLAEAVRSFSEATGYPVLAEPLSQLRRGPLAASGRLICSYDLIARSRPDALAPRIVVRLGELPTSKSLRQWLSSLEGLDQIVFEPHADWKEPTRTAGRILRADQLATLEALATRGGEGPGQWAEVWAGAERGAAAAVAGVLDGLDEASEPGVWRALDRVLADGDRVLAASSMPVRDLEAFMPPGPDESTFHANRGANGIDGLVSTAAGLAADGARTWAILGDLALLHDLGGLAVASRRESLRLVVLDNGGGGIFHFLPQAEAMERDEFEALLGTPSGLDIAAAGALFGIEAVTVSTDAELGTALAGASRMVIVKLDRDRNLELHREISAAAALE